MFLFFKSSFQVWFHYFFNTVPWYGNVGWINGVTIKTFVKILLCNARDYGRLAGTKQRKFTAENRSKNRINSRREVELLPILEHISTHYIRKPDHFNLNCFARNTFYQVFYWVWPFYPPHKQTKFAYSNILLSKYTILLYYSNVHWLIIELAILDMIYFNLSSHICCRNMIRRWSHGACLLLKRTTDHLTG